MQKTAVSRLGGCQIIAELLQQTSAGAPARRQLGEGARPDRSCQRRKCIGQVERDFYDLSAVSSCLCPAFVLGMAGLDRLILGSSVQILPRTQLFMVVWLT